MMSGFKGYVTSAVFMGERAPQHVQNIIIRDYCKRNAFHYVLSGTEYAMAGSSIILRQLIGELVTLEGIVAYSLFQMPVDKNIRSNIFSTIVEMGKELHFAQESSFIKCSDDIKRIEDIWSVRAICSSVILGQEIESFINDQRI